MPIGIVARLVHLTGQASRLENSATVPTRNSIGYGYVRSGGETLYFDPGAFKGDFDQLAVGQPVEFERDPAFAIATSLRLISREESARLVAEQPATSAPERTESASPRPAAAQAEAAPKAAPARPAKKPGEEAATLVLSDPRQCIVAVRYKQMAAGRWHHAHTEPEIETYTTQVADQYREPQITLVSDNLCTVRVFDEQAVNLRRVINFLGDYSAAQARCDAALLAKFPGAKIGEGNSDR